MASLIAVRNISYFLIQARDSSSQRLLKANKISELFRTKIKCKNQTILTDGNSFRFDDMC